MDLSRLAAAAAALSDVRLAVVFGSAARDALRVDSDVDVAVWLENNTLPVRSAVEQAFGDVCARALDFVVINDAAPQLRFEIAKGVLVFEREAGVWSAMKARAMIDWWDWEPTATAMHRIYIERLRAQIGRARAS